MCRNNSLRRSAIEGNSVIQIRTQILYQKKKGKKNNWRKETKIRKGVEETTFMKTVKTTPALPVVGVIVIEFAVGTTAMFSDPG